MLHKQRIFFLFFSKKNLRSSNNVSVNDLSYNGIVLSLQWSLFTISVFKSTCNFTVPWSLRATTPISQSTTESTNVFDISKKNQSLSVTYGGESERCILSHVGSMSLCCFNMTKLFFFFNWWESSHYSFCSSRSFNISVFLDFKYARTFLLLMWLPHPFMFHDIKYSLDCSEHY